MDPDQPAHPRSLIGNHAVRLQTLLQVQKLIANSMDPDQTAQAGLDPCWSQMHYVGFVYFILYTFRLFRLFVCDIFTYLHITCVVYVAINIFFINIIFYS
jgi:hypothetical protein